MKPLSPREHLQKELENKIATKLSEVRLLGEISNAIFKTPACDALESGYRAVNNVRAKGEAPYETQIAAFNAAAKNTATLIRKNDFSFEEAAYALAEKVDASMPLINKALQRLQILGNTIENV